MKFYQLAIILFLLTSSCTSEKRPTTKDLKAMFINDVLKKDKTEKAFFEIVNFEKINSREFTAFTGIKAKVFEYKVKLKVLDNCWKTSGAAPFSSVKSLNLHCYNKKPEQGMFFKQKYEKFDKGTLIEETGEFAFMITEKGLKSESGELY